MTAFNLQWPSTFLEALEQQGTAQLLGIKRGVERESLRVNASGTLASTAHPCALGAALTHPYLTTDYAESLLELVTPVASSLIELEHTLHDLHRFVYERLNEEFLWPLSMPCRIDHEDDITIATYGSSHMARMKHIYRVGLKHRYGSLMQAIAGVHYNFSLSDDFWHIWGTKYQDGLGSIHTQGYMHLVRNFYRVSWLMPYLFGASPAVSKAFLSASKQTDLSFERQGDMCFLPYATSLRLSGLGYTNHAQDQIVLDLNSLSGYVCSLQKAVKTTSPEFMKMGVKAQGEYIQLNDSYLQLENELYTPIRPKCVAKYGEKPSHALASRGIEYIELRACDVNPFVATGISREQIHFYDLLLLGCLWSPSPCLDAQSLARARFNLEQTAISGRTNYLCLQDSQGKVSLKKQGYQMLSALMPLAKCLDEYSDKPCYQVVLAQQLAKIEDPDLTLSAQVLEQSLSHQQGFIDWGMHLARTHKKQIVDTPYRFWNVQQLTDFVQASFARKQQIEAQDQTNFDQFLQAYMAPEP